MMDQTTFATVRIVLSPSAAFIKTLGSLPSRGFLTAEIST